MGKPDEGYHSKQQLPVVVRLKRCSPYVSLYTPEILICMWSTCHAITDWVNGWVTDLIIWYSSVCVRLCILTFISYPGMKSWDLHVCDRASTITHVDRVKKSNPWYNKIWLCLNVTIWSSQICFSVIFIHFVMIQNIWEKKLHLFTLFSITRHCFSLFLVGSKSMLALLPFKVTITPRHWNDKCYHRAGGDLICRFCICASHFPWQCIVGAQQEILCLTVRTTWLIWRVWPRSLGMSVPVWQRHREVKIEKCATKTQHFVASDAICTQFSVTWPHCGTVHDIFGKF